MKRGGGRGGKGDERNEPDGTVGEAGWEGTSQQSAMREVAAEEERRNARSVMSALNVSRSWDLQNALDCSREEAISRAGKRDEEEGKITSRDDAQSTMKALPFASGRVVAAIMALTTSGTVARGIPARRRRGTAPKMSE